MKVSKHTKDALRYEAVQKRNELPLPTWCFVLLGVPTFYMPAAYLVLAVWAGIQMLSGGAVGGTPPWLIQAIHPALYTTVGLWPVYIAWIGFSKRLTWREKLCWLFIVVVLNMVGMPAFYIFMIRRYLEIEGQPTKRDDAYLASFLQDCRLSRESLSSEQLRVLGSYCRKQRRMKYGRGPMIAVSCLLIYTALVYMPGKYVELFSDDIPSRIVVIDSENETRKEMSPDPETGKLFVKNIMMIGSQIGVCFSLGLFILVQSIMDWRGNWHHRAFMDYLKAAENGHS